MCDRVRGSSAMKRGDSCVRPSGVRAVWPLRGPRTAVLTLCALLLVAILAGSGSGAKSAAGPKVARGKLVGDIDGSGVVDKRDVWLLERALGASPQDPDWDERCDLDGDGFISFEDLSLLLANLGKAVSRTERPAGEGKRLCAMPRLLLAPSVGVPLSILGCDCGDSVVFEVQVSEDGQAVRVRPASSRRCGNLVGAVAMLARGWVFAPARDNEGKNVPSWCIVELQLDELGVSHGCQLPE